jgi:hypothetical protein
MHSHTVSKSTNRTDDTEESTDTTGDIANSSNASGKSPASETIQSHLKPSPFSKKSGRSQNFPLKPAAEAVIHKTEGIINRTERVLKQAEHAVKQAEGTVIQAQSIVKAAETILRQAENTVVIAERKVKRAVQGKSFEREVRERLGPEQDIFYLDPGGEIFLLFHPRCIG